MNRIILFTLAVVFTVGYVSGHASLSSPRSRNKIQGRNGSYIMNLTDGRTVYYRNPEAMQCGFFNNKPDNVEKKCSICGEMWNGPLRLNKGGDLYTGAIQETYTQGQVVPVTIQVSN